MTPRTVANLLGALLTAAVIGLDVLAEIWVWRRRRG